jgi:hypothetical protein
MHWPSIAYSTHCFACIKHPDAADVLLACQLLPCLLLLALLLLLLSSAAPHLHPAQTVKHVPSVSLLLLLLHRYDSQIGHGAAAAAVGHTVPGRVCLQWVQDARQVAQVHR